MNASVDYVKKLGKLHRSALPTAVRATLNNAAFDVKKNTMPASAKDEFTQRSPNFFKANSRVQQANGWNIDGMKSVVGFVPLSGTNKAVDDLEQQEHGGKIKGRSFIAMRTGRVSKSTSKNVQKKNRISTIKNIVKAQDSRGSNSRQKFVKAVIHAGVGGFVLSERGVLWKINSITNKNNRTFFKATPIQSFKKGRDISVKATHFMQQSAEKSAKKMPLDFKREAERQFKKYLG